MMATIHVLAQVLALWSGFTTGHTVITYPGWRGNNLGLNDTFPYGMQWSYPCGGLLPTTNRTNWPVKGGSIAIQPGWYAGHRRSLIYINIGFGVAGPFGGPDNPSALALVSPFQINGPSDQPYPATFCLPEVSIPDGMGVRIGDLATIQVVETSIHGGAAYNCVDIIFSAPEDAPQVNASNCFNSSSLRFSSPFVDPQPLTTASSVLSTASSVARFSSTATGCPVCPTPSASACPKTNGIEKKDVGGMGVGFGLGLLIGEVLR